MVHQFLRGFSKMKNRYYKVCEICGSNLDPGEKCTCLKEKKEQEDEKAIKQKVNAFLHLSKLGGKK